MKITHFKKRTNLFVYCLSFIHSFIHSFSFFLSAYLYAVDAKYEIKIIVIMSRVIKVTELLMA
jgi:hypothetical protein